MSEPGWLRAYFDDVDAMRLDAFLDRLTPDVEVRFGSAPTLHGREAVREAIGGLFAAIDGIRHNVGGVWEFGDTTVFEHDVDYTRKDGRVVNVPATTIFVRQGELVSQLRGYIDLAPVFADA